MRTTMKRLIWIVLPAWGCGGSEQLARSSSAATAASGLPDVSGGYTLNQYAGYLVGGQPDTLALTGQMALFQDGSKVGGVAFLKIPNPTNRGQASYFETRTWSGTITREQNGAVVVRLADPASDVRFVGVVDSAGNLRGSPGENHGYCPSSYLAFGCDALRN